MAECPEHVVYELSGQMPDLLTMAQWVMWLIHPEVNDGMVGWEPGDYERAYGGTGGATLRFLLDGRQDYFRFALGDYVLVD